MALLPHARVPEEDDGAYSITVVRSSTEAGYIRIYRKLPPTIHATLGDLPAMSHVGMLPPFLGRPSLEEPAVPLLNGSHHLRNHCVPYLFGWRQREYASYPRTERHHFYVPAPSWWCNV